MGFGHCLASQFPRIPTVCHGHPVQSFCDHPCLQASFHPRLDALLGDFFVIPTSCRWHLVQSFCIIPCPQASFRPRLDAKPLRRDGDSNPGNPFGVYTLSRRASSTTRASLLIVMINSFSLIGYKITAFLRHTQTFMHFF